MAEETLSKKVKGGEVCPSPSRSPWSQLPPDILTRLSLHLFGTNVEAAAVIPKVCKSWNNFMDYNRTMALIITSLPDPPLDVLPPQYPCFMIWGYKQSLCRFIHPNRNFTIDFPELSDFHVCCSKFGWLLLFKFCYRKEFYIYLFFNPFTRQKIMLPSSEELFTRMSFSSRPTSPDCFVIGMDNRCRFAITKRGEQKWEFYGSTGQYYMSLPHLALCGDRCYAIGDKSKIVVFDVKQKSVDFIANPFGLPSSATRLCNEAEYLVENRAELLSVIVTYQATNIYVARMNPSTREWLPVETLENKMLFVSRRASMLRPAPVKAAGNKIYFPKLLNDDKYVPYCLATKKYVPFIRHSSYTSGTGTWIDTMPLVPASSARNQQIDW